MKDQSKDTAGNDLASTYGQHHQWDRKINAVSIVKYERHDHCIGDDRWKWGKEPTGITQLVSKNCAQQCGNASDMMSTGIQPPRILAMIHPTNNPGIAAGVK